MGLGLDNSSITERSLPAVVEYYSRPCRLGKEGAHSTLHTYHPYSVGQFNGRILSLVVNPALWVAFGRERLAAVELLFRQAVANVAPLVLLNVRS